MNAKQKIMLELVKSLNGSIKIDEKTRPYDAAEKVFNIAKTEYEKIEYECKDELDKTLINTF